MNIFGDSDAGEIKEYLPCPKYEKGRPWQVGKNIAGLCVKNAEEYLSWTPRVITASDYMLFFKTGDRTVFEGEHFKRRSALGSVMLAECVEASGRFLAKAADLAWMICEESFWGLPATRARENDDVLPDDSRPDLELFACETGGLLGYLLYIMGDALAEISPMLRVRIERELEKRIIIPFLERSDFTWMGLGGCTGDLWELSNWTPWCYSNCLAVLLLAEKDESRKRRGIKKVMAGLDRFLSDYRSDGGCDEGCGYWSRSAGSMFECLEMLNAVTQTDMFSLPIVKNMGNYIADCCIGNGYFVNFADAGAKIIPEAALVYRYGMKTGSGNLCALGKSFIDGYLEKRYRVISQSPMRIIPAILNYGEIAGSNASFNLNAARFYDKTQVCMLRRGNWFIAGKGGNNNETHNHNDVGSFVLFYNGNPVFIDAGVEKYSEKTFGEHRYELWTMQSDYHNLPRINGASQRDGEKYHADGFSCSENRIACEIQNAYPAEAQVKLWKREIYEKDGSVFLEEAFEFEKPVTYEIMFMTPHLPKIGKSGITIGDVIMCFENDKLSAETDTVDISDDGLKAAWGSAVYRIRLFSEEKTISGKVVFHIKNINTEERK